MLRVPAAVVASVLLFTDHAGIAAELTATFVGGTPDDVYNTASNWDIAQVPLNNVTDQFNVVVPASFAVMFDVDPASAINDFTLAPSASFTVPGGHSLTVLDDTSIGGTLTANSTDALFQATGAGAAFHPTGARLFAIGSGTIDIAATTFTNTSLGSGTQFSADGTGSLLDLSSLLSYTDALNAGGSPARTVSATNNGVVDLRNVGTVTGPSPSFGDFLRFHVASGGSLNLDGLLTISGSTRLDIDNPSYTLPGLLTASGTTIDLANGSTFTAGAMTDFVSGAVLFDGDNPGTFQATSLNKFTGSSVNLAPGQNFNVIATGLVDIDGAQISVRGGVQFGTTQIAAPTFTNTSLGSGTQFSADGTGSLLDLSSLLSYTDALNAGGSPARTVSATNNGVVDLRNVGTVTGPSPSFGDFLRFHVASGGSLNLDGLLTISGSTRLDIDNPSYTLPSLLTASGTTVDLANGSTFTAGAMTDFVSGAVLFDGDNPGTFQATSLNKFTGSSVNLAPGQNFNVIATGLVDIDGAQISVRGGVQFGTTQIAAPTFTNTSLGSGTQFSADGTGSLLDLSSLLSYTDALNAGGSPARTVSATNNGVVDLRNVGTVTGPSPSFGDFLRFHVASGGSLNLDGLLTISGSTRLDIDNPSYTLPSLLTASGTTVDLANGSTFTAGAMTDFVSGAVLFDGDNPGTFQATSLNKFTGSSVNLAPGQNFNVIATGLVDIDGAQISVRGGVQFGTTQIAAPTFTNTSLGSGTQFSADGTGSLLDLSSLLSYTDALNAGGSPARTVSATNNGVVDLRNVGTVTGPSPSFGDFLRFHVASGGQLLLGNFNTSGNVQFSGDGSESEIHIAGNVNLASGSSLVLTNAATLTVGADFLFGYTNEADLNLDAGIVAIEGPDRHYIEVGGEDLGVDGATAGNFGIGQLVVGTETDPAFAVLTEFIDNGNRNGDEREALYLYGLGGPDGLELLSGSTLAIGNIDTYAFVDGEMVHLNSLFGPEVNVVPFGEGFLVADALPGDYSGNGVVDLADYTVWRDTLGTTGLEPYELGDGDGDGSVTADDYRIWKDQFGSSLPAAAVAAATLVPEPTGVALAMCGAAGTWLATRRRNRSRHNRMAMERWQPDSDVGCR